MNESFYLLAPQPRDAVVLFRYAGQLYKEHERKRKTAWVRTIIIHWIFDPLSILFAAIRLWLFFAGSL